MGRLVIAVDKAAGVSAAELAAAWGADNEARRVGMAQVETSGRTSYIPGLVELVVIPLAVNLASSAISELVRRLVSRLRPDETAWFEVELAESVATASGDRVVVVRVSQEIR